MITEAGMKIKERIKNVGFWVSLISSVFLILGAFGVEIGDETASSIINAVCSLLVVTGIVSDPTTGKGYLDVAEKTSGDVPDSALAEIVAAMGDGEHIEQSDDVAPEKDGASGVDINDDNSR